MRILAALLLAVAFLFPSTAAASPLVHPDFQQYTEWLAGSRMPVAKGDVIFHLQGCPVIPGGAGSCVIDLGIPGRLDLVYVDPNEPEQRLVLFHEMGHVFDHQYLSPGEKRKFVRLIGHDGAPWNWPNKGAKMLELFASAYSACAANPDYPDFDGQYGWMPNPTLHRTVCRFIVRAYKRP